MPLNRVLIPTRVETVEMIDSHAVSDHDFAESFADVARVNRYLGGTAAVLRPLRRLIQAQKESRPLRILDIATGSADIPRAIIEAKRQGKFGTAALEITATDNHPAALRLAKAWTPAKSYPEIRIESADALNLPYADGTFDFALCSLAFHHFGQPQISTALHEMERVTTAGFIVNDLLRDRIAWAAILLLTRLLRAHRFTRHDAPASVLRAYTKSEYAAMVRETGIPISIRVVPMYRAVLVRDKTI